MIISINDFLGIVEMVVRPENLPKLVARQGRTLVFSFGIRIMVLVLVLHHCHLALNELYYSRDKNDIGSEQSVP